VGPIGGGVGYPRAAIIGGSLMGWGTFGNKTRSVLGCLSGQRAAGSGQRAALRLFFLH